MGNPWANHGQLMGKSWASHGQVMGKSWASQRQTMGNSWANHGQSMGNSRVGAPRLALQGWTVPVPASRQLAAGDASRAPWHQPPACCTPARNAPGWQVSTQRASEANFCSNFFCWYLRFLHFAPGSSFFLRFSRAAVARSLSVLQSVALFVSSSPSRQPLQRLRLTAGFFSHQPQIPCVRGGRYSALGRESSSCWGPQHSQ